MFLTREAAGMADGKFLRLGRFAKVRSEAASDQGGDWFAPFTSCRGLQ